MKSNKPDKEEILNILRDFYSSNFDTKTALPKLLSLLTQAHNSAIEEMIELVGEDEEPKPINGIIELERNKLRAELRQKLEGLISQQVL